MGRWEREKQQDLEGGTILERVQTASFRVPEDGPSLLDELLVEVSTWSSCEIPEQIAWTPSLPANGVDHTVTTGAHRQCCSL